jgi:hypothetical protein
MKDPFDLPANTLAKKKASKLCEGDIQKACVAYARSKGYWARKFSSPSQRSVPDYLFGKHFTVLAGDEQMVWAEEFKAPKKHSTETQTEEQDKMVAAGWWVIRDTGTNGQADIDAFKARIDALERSYG